MSSGLRRRRTRVHEYPSIPGLPSVGQNINQTIQAFHEDHPTVLSRAPRHKSHIKRNHRSVSNEEVEGIDKELIEVPHFNDIWCRSAGLNPDTSVSCHTEKPTHGKRCNCDHHPSMDLALANVRFERAVRAVYIKDTAHDAANPEPREGGTQPLQLLHPAEGDAETVASDVHLVKYGGEAEHAQTIKDAPAHNRIVTTRV